MPTEEPRNTDTGESREAEEQETTDRARAVEETAGALSGVYEPRELERLRGDWPEVPPSALPS